MRLVVGLVGKIGSGKTTVAEYICGSYGAEQRGFSRILMDILDRLCLPHDRVNLQRLGGMLRKGFGGDVVVNAFERDLESTKSGVVLVDGIRYMNEVEMLRRFPGSILIYIDAFPEIRYERIRKRGEKGESTISFDEFLAAEKRETERYIGELRPEADYIINNSGTLEDLLSGVDGIMKREVP